jgi:hypothetical protein
MIKLIISEEEKKFILSLHGIVEQTVTTTATTTPTTLTKSKPMFGTPEQRAAAVEKRKENRRKIFDNFLKGAFIKNFYEVVDDDTFALGCTDEKADETPYIEGTSPEIPDYVYRELTDGKKIKFDLKKYKRYVKNLSKSEDVALDGIQGPEFKSTSCGISKAAARQSRSDWKKK